MTDPVTSKKQTAAFGTLIALLVATYLLAHFDLGPLNMPLGLAIATLKALLVVLYFMHLRYTSGIQRIAAGIGVFWLSILILLGMTDYLSRTWLLLPGPWPG